MRNAAGLYWTLLAALLGSCSVDDNAQETRIQQETGAVDQRRSAGTPPRVLPGVPSQATAVLAGHTKKVWHAAFSADGSCIVTASGDTIVHA